MLTILVICFLFHLFSCSYGCMSMAPTPDSSLARSPNRNPDEAHSSAQNWRSQAIVHKPAHLSASKSQVLKSPPPRQGSAQARLFTPDPYAGKRQRSRALAPSQGSLASKALTAGDKVTPTKVFPLPPSKPVEMLSDWATLEFSGANSTHNQDLNDYNEASGQQASLMEQTEMIILPENPMDDHQQNICELCPPLLMKELGKSHEDKHYCLNWKSIKESFNIVVSSTLPRVHDLNSSVGCTRIVTCEEPFVLVRWHNSTICDMHSLSYSLDNLSSSFSYKCNGTSWSLHNFPIDSVACASKVLP